MCPPGEACSASREEGPGQLVFAGTTQALVILDAFLSSLPPTLGTLGPGFSSPVSTTYFFFFFSFLGTKCTEGLLIV